MSEKNYGNNSQLAELVKYISDEMKFPIMGAGGGYAPIGTINFFDATVAPLGWLACDGSIHNISDYPDLATFYASQHGASNYYGGNGTTTFAVPNLQGEFLRGAGTNGHTNQGNGGSVGEHQDGTEHLSMARDTNLSLSANTVDSLDTENKDSEIGQQNVGSRYVGTNSYSGGDAVSPKFTSRPTNTSFLICVKATLSDTELNNMHVYSPNEHQVGWWQEEVDGVLKQKPVYQKTIPYTTSKGTGFMAIWNNTPIEKLCGTQLMLHSMHGYWFTNNDNNGVASRLIFDKANSWSTNGLVYQGSSEYTDIIVTVDYIKTSDQWQTV